jgi:hypothetical protein
MRRGHEPHVCMQLDSLAAAWWQAVFGLRSRVRSAPAAEGLSMPVL